MKKMIVVFAVSSLVLLAGCARSGYNSEYVYNFVDACMKNGGTPGYCFCLMDTIQSKISQKEFLDEDAKFAAEKKFTDKFSKAFEEGKARCRK